MPERWLLYGAYGFTGRLIAQAALARGHQPVLSGRSAEKLAALGKHLQLETLASALENLRSLREAIEGFDLVVNAAGPFTYTSRPLIDACLDTHTHYLDITAAELPVYRTIYARDTDARQASVALVPGAGFDVAATECLAAHAAALVQKPTRIRLGIQLKATPSSGSVKTMLEVIGNGQLARIDGRLHQLPTDDPLPTPRFPGEPAVKFSPVPTGDLEAVYHSTQIPNIATYMSGPSIPAGMEKLLTKKPVRNLVRRVAGMLPEPSEAARARGRAYVWVQATGASGEVKEWLLRTGDGYTFTALAAVLGAEKLLAGGLAGALTPSMAFGTDFPLEIPGVERTAG